jgi:SET domain-containing protein
MLKVLKRASQTPEIILRDAKRDRGLFTLEPIAKNGVIIWHEQRFIDAPSRTSLQVDEEMHQEATDGDALENYVNHACRPNGYIDFSTLTLRARHIIEPGEELTFNYNTTEWNMVEGFQCTCDCQGCYGLVLGFKALNLKEQKTLAPWASPFLLAKLNLFLQAEGAAK